MRFVLHTVVLAAIGILSAPASAQLSDVNTTTEGRGTARANGRSYTLDEASIVLRPNRRFDATFFGRDARFRITGTWTANGDDEARLRPDNGNGSGIARFRSRNRLVSLELNGNGSGYGTYSFLFQADARPFGDRPGNWDGELSETVHGEGTLVIGGTTLRLSQMGVQLHRGGRADLYIQETNGNERKMSGDWFDRRNNQIDLRIDAGLDSRDTSGRGQVILENNRLFRVEVDGRTGGRSFDLRFQRTGDAWSPDAGSRSFTDSRSGDGTIRIGDGRGDLNRASVVLRSNGDAEISVSGSKSYSLRGRWRQTIGVYTVTVTSGLGSGDTDGSGTVTVSGSTLRRLQFSGTTGRNRYTIDFATDGIGGGSGSNQPFDINQTRDGEGTVRYRDVVSPIERATVDLNRDGSFSVRLSGRSDWQYRGTWTDTNGGATLRVRSGGRNGSAVGSGLVRISSGRFWRVELDVVEGGTTYRIRFEAQ